MKWHGDKDRKLIKELRNVLDSKATIRGRVIEIRDLGGIIFIIVVDRSGLCQLVVDSPKKLPALQSIISCTGRVVANEKAPTGFVQTDLISKRYSIIGVFHCAVQHINLL
jgi:aspartyl/asparaginyl-tRNA synthetase